MKLIIQKIYQEEYEKLVNANNIDNKKIYVFYDSSMINHDSVYLKVKSKYAKLFNVDLFIFDLNNNSSIKNHELMTKIKLNNDFLFFELPLSESIWKENYFQYLNNNNDIDGLYAPNLIDDKYSEIKYHPATVEAVLSIINNIENLKNKKILIIGRSIFLGNYLFKYLKRQNFDVFQAHSKTLDVYSKLKNYDVVISCINQPLIYDVKNLKNNSYLIDVTTEIVNNKLVGSFVIDANYAKLHNIKYTPVPGGVGKLTTLFLFKNYFK